MNLQENIQRIKEVMGINENLDSSIKRRLYFFIDDMIAYQHSIVNRNVYLNSFNFNELVETITDNIIEDVYYKYYGDMDDQSDEWKEIYDKLHPYIQKNTIEFLNKQPNVPRKLETSEAKESGEKWIKCVNCKKKFTQTIHKGKKSLPICPHCGTNNDLVTESEVPVYIRRRLLEELPNFIRNTYEWLAPWTFNSYEEYMSKIIFNVVREISSSLGDATYEEMMKIREKIEPMITNYIVDNFSDEIEEYYSDNLTPG